MTMLIRDSLAEFSLALEKNEPVYVKSDGQWGLQKRSVQKINEFFHRDHVYLKKIGAQLCRLLDEAESSPVKILKETDAVERKQYVRLLNACKVALKTLEKKKKCAKSSLFLKRKMIALKYRIGSSYEKGKDPVKDFRKQEFRMFVNVAAEWKQSELMYQPIDRELSKRDLSRLKETLSFPKFIPLLNKNAELKKQFFEWIIRDGGHVQEFIEYPATWQILKKSFLTSRATAYRSHDLAVVVLKSQKFLSLPFEIENEKNELRIEKINILDQKAFVTLKNQWTLTIGEIFKKFARKNDEIGDVEYIGAVKNWNCHVFGSYNPKTGKHEEVDLEDPEWYKSLPVQEIVSAKTLERRFSLNPKILDGKNYLFLARASQGCLKEELAKSHGFIEICVPQTDGKYRLYAIGKFAADFPTRFCDLMLFPASTKRSRYSYPDENRGYHHRRQAIAPFVLSSEEGAAMLNLICDDLKVAAAGNSVFQFGADNCTFWVQNLLNRLHTAFKKEPPEDLFQMPVLNAKTAQPFKAIFGLMRRINSVLREKFFRILEYVLRAHKGIYIEENGKCIYKSLSKSSFRNLRTCYIPALLHKKILRGDVDGVVSYGSKVA